MKPPNFIGTSMDHSVPYISRLEQVPTIISVPPVTTAESSFHSAAFRHLPAPLQPAKTAAVHASKNAIDRLKELFAKVRS